MCRCCARDQELARAICDRVGETLL